ncbi:hypothetical protein Franean1_0209 [Parafrankia sp. EAN1pec]|nr:hypothetical protein Franean1_0209 [Frankia sp. EAN1pec]
MHSFSRRASSKRIKGRRQRRRAPPKPRGPSRAPGGGPDHATRRWSVEAARVLPWSLLADEQADIAGTSRSPGHSGRHRRQGHKAKDDQRAR